MTIHLIGREHEDRQRMTASVRAHKIDQLAPDHREAVLAAERYLDNESTYGKETEQRLHTWRHRPSGPWMSASWLKSFTR